MQEPLAPHVSFGIGGTADVWVEPRTTGDILAAARAALSREMPLKVIGCGSNILFPDAGFRGMVMSLTAAAREEYRSSGGQVCLPAGMLLSSAIAQCGRDGLGGLEFFAGIPGTLGGALACNAGCRDADDPSRWHAIWDYVRDITLWRDGFGCMRRMGHEVHSGYRYADFGSGIVLSACLSLPRERESSIRKRRERYLSLKRRTQDLRYPSAGCVFKNPESGLPAGRLIEESGLKGHQVGGARVSEIHANFIVNDGSATANDVRALIDLCRERVMKHTGIFLETEIEIVE